MASMGSSVACWGGYTTPCSERSLGGCMESGGDLDDHQPKQGHGNQERARVGHVTGLCWTQTLKET